MTVHPESLVHGLAAVRAGHPGMPNLSADDVSEEHIADTIADLLHFAASVGIDPDEAFDHGRRYFEGDVTDDTLDTIERPTLTIAPTPAEELPR